MRTKRQSKLTRFFTRLGLALILLSLAPNIAPVQATQPQLQAEWDYGDAPDPPYPTLFSPTGGGGASHILGTDVYLGSCVDAEPNGQPDLTATGDDLNAGSPVYGSCVRETDEDGVNFVTPLYAGQQADIFVIANAPCTLSAWVDFNGNGSWADDDENLFPGGQALVFGPNALSFAVPVGATAGPTFARFRCTTDGAVGYGGEASDGEVEDYLVAILPPLLDLGDAPDQPYPTLLASGGASHFLGSGVYLGSCVDAETDGQPTAGADGDDMSAGSPVYGACAGGDDEDGVTFTTPLLPGQTAGISVVASMTCTLSAWIDFAGDGNWDAGDDLFPGGQLLVPGVNSLTFSVLDDISWGPTYARFRCTTDGVVEYAGLASDGEVEDYLVGIGPALDLGDAPDEPYRTLLANSGAVHVLGSNVYLGRCVDAETDGQPTAAADGDDMNASSPVFGACPEGIDEDGVIFTTLLVAGDAAEIEVTANAACTLSAWVDFNADGDWEDTGEDLFPGGKDLVPGVNPLDFAVPAGAKEGNTYARFRCTTQGAVEYAGLAEDGEVEDYRVTIGARDFGDAPDKPYRTLLMNSGPSHALGSEVYLGKCVDAELDGQPTVNADGDDVNAGSPVVGDCTGDDDEDGVVFTTPLLPGEMAEVEVTANADCTLSAWIDFNADGDWDDTGEDLFPGGKDLAPGVNPLKFEVPMGAERTTTYARFRCTTGGAVEYAGPASDGEVEDYMVRIGLALDLGDAPDKPYPTLLARLGANHVLGSDVYLGSCVDADVDGQPTIGADGDDVNVGSPVIGTCTDGDDEDGVTFTTPLVAGETAEVEVVASADCTLSAWIDFNADGDWADVGENLFPGGKDLVPGVNSLSFVVQAATEKSVAYARFRCTTTGAVPPTGQARDGEVEDYQVTVLPSPFDLGDAPDLPYRTLLAHSGASHLLGSDVYLGSCVDADPDGQPTVNADGDDVNVGSPVYGTCVRTTDEDGVVFVTPLYADSQAEILVTANAACTLSAWIDFSRDGDWVDYGEELFPGGQALVAGSNLLTFTVPDDIPLGDTYARFRCTTEGAVGFAGMARDGEVEDYQVTVAREWDLGDAPDQPYPTLLANSGAVHMLGSGVYLGSCVDAEPDGQPTVAANGDDLNVGGSSYGFCASGDDEDGVNFVTPLVAGEMAVVQVTANEPCTLTAWIDYNADGVWSDPAEALFPGGQWLTGTHVLVFIVPPEVALGGTYARFRCTTAGPVGPTGYAPDGEVEDYRVWLGTPADFGDAPDPTYPTLQVNSGAFHLLGSSVYLGTCVDADLDGQPTLAANGDDVNIGSPVFGSCVGGDDEDGVIFLTPLVPGADANVLVIANDYCTLTGWADFNADGVWGESPEELFVEGASLVPGGNFLSFDVPEDVAEGSIYARFRCATNGAWEPTGFAPDGEVEDYLVTIGQTLDLGDAPDPTYPTLLASGGAHHTLGSGVFLGACVDGEPDGQPTAGADGDDVNIGSPVYGNCAHDDDEDGVFFLTPLNRGGTTHVGVVANAPCLLSAWVDFNADGDWLDGGENIFPGGQTLAPGPNALSFAVPANAVEGDTYARFRCTTAGVVEPTGYASDGEVEDYLVTISSAWDFGDAPDPAYPTLSANSGASHLIGSNVFLGTCVDAEMDGQPTAAADGDDISIGGQVYGRCIAGDDEDGVTFTTPWLAGQPAEVGVVANAPCTLSAWADFNRDGDWSDPGEDLFPGGQPLGAGVNVLNFPVPAGAVEGNTYARFRCTTAGPVGFDGPAPNGEVEDYPMWIGTALDFGDAPDPTYPTLLASDGASHVLGSGVYLGSCVDAEPDGQPTAAADGDNVNAGSPVIGTCVGYGDEDGVFFTPALTMAHTAEINVLANISCTLSAWADFNRDGDWLDTGEDLFPGGQPLVAGTNPLSFTVPTVAIGDVYFRFRCTTDGAVEPTGQASDGEVEDYRVAIRGYPVYLPLALKDD